MFLLPFLVVFITSLYQPIDADLGWHLKHGQYFFEHGQILRDNIFSTEMAEFKWANSSWGTDLITYAVYSVFGFWGLSVLAAFVITLSFYFVSLTAKLDFFEKSVIFPFLIFLLEPVNLVSFRGQLISLLFLTILFYILTKLEETKTRLIYLLIPLFVIWINLHGEFILGLGLTFIWGATYLFKLILKSWSFTELLGALKILGPVFILSTLGTLINPFGMEIYKTQLTHFQNPSLKDIIEYLPLDQFSSLWWNHLMLSLFLVASVAIIYFSGELKSKLTVLFPSSIILALSFLVRRYSWVLYYLVVPLLKPIASLFKPKDKADAQHLGSFILITYFILVVLINNPFSRIGNMSWESFCQRTSCSPKAAEYLIQNGYSGNLLTLYNWGGWLIWNYPEIKPSIDGRMHLWKDQNGYSAFSEYYPLEQNLADIDQSKYDTVFISPEKPIFKRLGGLVEEGKWKVVYQDEQASIFVRN